MKHATILLAVGAAILLGPAQAHAQSQDEPGGFFAIYGGAQPQRRTISAEQSFPLFDETATVSSTQRIRNGGLIKAGVGFPLKGALGIGGGFSYFGRPGTAVITAKLPDPSFFDRITTQQFDSDNLKHTELGFHISLLYQKAISPKLGMTLLVGPSIIRVEQDIATVSVSNTGQATVAKEAQSGNAFGAHGGVDLTYRLKPGLGLGLFVHYVGGKVDLPSAPGMTVGGPQAGLVLRVGL